MYSIPDERHPARALQFFRSFGSAILSHNPLEARTVLGIGEATPLAFRKAFEFIVVDAVGQRDLGEGIG